MSNTALIISDDKILLEQLLALRKVLAPNLTIITADNADQAIANPDSATAGNIVIGQVRNDKSDMVSKQFKKVAKAFPKAVVRIYALYSIVKKRNEISLFFQQFGNTKEERSEYYSELARDIAAGSKLRL